MATKQHIKTTPNGPVSPRSFQLSGGQFCAKDPTCTGTPGSHRTDGPTKDVYKIYHFAKAIGDVYQNGGSYIHLVFKTKMVQ